MINDPEKYKNKYKIASSRLQSWDYGWDAAYFIAICTKNKEHYFGEIIDGKMILSNVGIIANVLWYEIKNHADNLSLGEFTVMPNHIHGILILNSENNKKPILNNNITDIAQNSPNSDVETRHALSLPDALSLQSNTSLPKQSPTNLKIPKFELPPYFLGPNDIIGKKRFQNPGENTISTIIGGYKSAVSKHINRLNLQSEWQTRFHDHIIRDEAEYIKISNYIKNNPKNWKEDKFYT